ncbi:uncharacterized protein [Oscarella lobularis]|uniref:uncharacterized protein n=1 Tax=Oscarella lobularis TaxID=121494 RepID=UPI003313CFD7
MTLLYHRLMTPNWLDQNATFNCQRTVQDLELQISTDSSKYENIFKVPLLKRGVLKSGQSDVTIRIKVGIVLPEPARPRRDPILFMASDGNKFAMGFQLRNPSESDYTTKGPYYGVDGEPGRILRNYAKRSTDVPVRERVNPDQFEILLKPSDYWGSIYSALDGGHKLNTTFASTLNLSNGLWLDVYRVDVVETYIINYVEVTVYEDSPKC